MKERRGPRRAGELPRTSQMRKRMEKFRNTQSDSMKNLAQIALCQEAVSGMARAVQRLNSSTALWSQLATLEKAGGRQYQMSSLSVEQAVELVSIAAQLDLVAQILKEQV